MEVFSIVIGDVLLGVGLFLIFKDVHVLTKKFELIEKIVNNEINHLLEDVKCMKAEISSMKKDIADIIKKLKEKYGSK